MAFKLTEEQFGQLTYTRIYQGKLCKGEQVINSRTGNKMRIGRMVRMHSNDRENIDEAEAGDIVLPTVFMPPLYIYFILFLMGASDRRTLNHSSASLDGRYEAPPPRPSRPTSLPLPN